MKFFKVSALVIAATMMSTMTAAFADNVVEESNSEAFAQSFIKNYYSSMYLDEEFDDSNIEFDELREYIRTKINYMQFVTSDVENFDIQMELISKDESTDAIYLAYFVEAEYNYVGLDTPSGFGECVQIVVDKNLEQEICDFYVYDNWDNRLRDANSINADYIVWENEQSAMQLVYDIQERTTNSINVIEEQANITDTLLDDDNYSVSSVSSSNRTKIVNYALDNCSKKSPASGNSNLVSTYYDFSQISNNYDCTNFSSHCLLAGGAVFQDDNSGNRGGWFYYGTSTANRSMSWSSVNYFYDFATTNTGVGPKAKTFSLRYNCPSSMINYNIGEFIQVKYDDDSDGYDHTLVITDITGSTSTSLYPYVTGRSGYNSGITTWYVKNKNIMENYSGDQYRVLAFTSLT